jgi:drug/metabolite transporter (DMT)-like permease
VTASALALVLVAAVMHATWNFFAKRLGGGVGAVWLYSALSTVCLAPIAAAVVWLARPALSSVAVVFMLGSAILHLGYFVTLQSGYREGDLSVVYPLARGTGPLLAAIAAVSFFGERPTLLAMAGAALIAGGIFALAGGRAIFGLGGRPSPAGVGYGLLTGIFIAAYTLWDKQAVAVIGTAPIVQTLGENFGRSVLLIPAAWLRRTEVARHWNEHRALLFWIALLAPLGYTLVLTAMVFTPVSYVAPAREISILIGTAMGTRWLAEGRAPLRLAGAAAMVVGLIALALG